MLKISLSYLSCVRYTAQNFLTTTANRNLWLDLNGCIGNLYVIILGGLKKWFVLLMLMLRVTVLIANNVCTWFVVMFSFNWNKIPRESRAWQKHFGPNTDQFWNVVSIHLFLFISVIEFDWLLVRYYLILKSKNSLQFM